MENLLLEIGNYLLIQITAPLYSTNLPEFEKQLKMHGVLGLILIWEHNVLEAFLDDVTKLVRPLQQKGFHMDLS
jgi:hypothetical protein